MKIWKKIYKDFPDWRLSIVGDGPDRKMLEGYCEKRGLCRIHFYGYTDPKPFYERASILCMTSEYEGFPMVLTEAMQFGCIPIAYDSFDAVKDIIKDGNSGILVPPFSMKEYTNQLACLMSDEEKLKRMSEYCMQDVTRFSIDSIVDQWEHLFETLKEE